MKEQAQEWLINWFHSHRKTGRLPAEQLVKIDFLEAGMLTSMEIVELITEIENNFDIQFSEADLQDSRLVKILGLSELVAERVAQ